MRALRLDDTAYDEAMRGIAKAKLQFGAMRKALEMSLEGDLVEDLDGDVAESPEEELEKHPKLEERAERERALIRRNWPK